MPKVKVTIQNQQRAVKLPGGMRTLIRRSCAEVLKNQRFENDAEVIVTLVDDDRIHELNAEFRNVDRATDVLSFPLIDFEGGEECPFNDPEMMLGDIVISLERAREQAEEYGHSFERETAFLCVHSMLHLLGYDHVNGGEEEADMRRRQTEILEAMGLGVK